MKTQLLITTALIAGLTYSVAAKAAPLAVTSPDLGVNQADQPGLDVLAANKAAPRYKIKGVNVDDDGESADDNSKSDGDGESQDDNG